MDINKALSAHQIALIRASSSHDKDKRKHLREVADHIADHIALYRVNHGAPPSHLLPADTV